jgi:hypothetical protein
LICAYRERQGWAPIGEPHPRLMMHCNNYLPNPVRAPPVASRAGREASSRALD